MQHLICKTKNDEAANYLHDVTYILSNILSKRNDC